MSELCVKKIKQSKLLRAPHMACRNITNAHETTSFVQLKRLELLKQVGVLVSFTCALKFASNQNQWSIGDCEFLLDRLLWLEEQLSFWGHKLKANAEHAELRSEGYVKLEHYGKSASRYVSDAIAAVNAANSNELALALEAITNKLQLMQQIFQHVLE